MNKHIIIALTIICFSCASKSDESYIIKKGNVKYDFSFAELTIRYLETEDSIYLKEIGKLKATEHLLNHANQFNYDVPKETGYELAKYLLSPLEEKKKKLVDFKRNLEYAKSSIAEIDLAQKICLQYLPDDFQYSSNLYFTFGYDLGVVFGSNSSLNLAHPYYIQNLREIKYYSIHELHHAGFVMLKKNIMPSLNINTFKEMADLIEYLTHLEGMGTYAPLDIRIKESAMNSDRDYIALQNIELMREYEKEYFEIYFHFKNNPDNTVSDEDWEKVFILSDKKRLWYRVGAHMAQTIDTKLGREKLTSLIVEPSENFINTYLSLKQQTQI